MIDTTREELDMFDYEVIHATPTAELVKVSMEEDEYGPTPDTYDLDMIPGFNVMDAIECVKHVPTGYVHVPYLDVSSDDCISMKYTTTEIAAHISKT